MQYDLIFLEEARASLKAMSPDVAARIVRKIERLRHDLAGDVKRLRAFVPNYRLRAGDCLTSRGRTIVIHQIKHRSKAYDELKGDPC